MLKNIKNGGYCTIAELGLSTYSLALFSFHSWLPVRKKICGLYLNTLFSH